MVKYRRTDPGTSKIAAHQVEASGHAATQLAMCLAAVKARGGRTAAEIARIAGLERHVPSRRLPELREYGGVENGFKRICNVTGRLSMTWWIV